MNQLSSDRYVGWLKTWWGKFFLALIAMGVLSLLVLSGLIGYYWWKINHGEAEDLGKKIGVIDNSVAFQANARIRSEVEISNRPYIGSLSAPIVIVEFVDFKCPYCRMAAPILKQVLDKYSNKVRLVIRNFPVESIHPGASRLGEVAMCADEQGKFWFMHDYFYEHQDNIGADITTDDIYVWSDLAGMNKKLLDQCLASGRARIIVNQDYTVGFKQGILGTPTFFVNGVKVEGVPSFQSWDNYLKTL